MNPGQVARAKNGNLSLSGDLSFATVPEIWAQARPLIRAAASPLTMDLKEVSRSDSAGLALLIECLREGRRGRKEVSFVNMPDQMRAIARVTGLDRVFPRLPKG